MARDKLEIFNNGRWLVVSENIFRSWGGRRRKNGKSYTGKVYYLGSKKVYSKKNPWRKECPYCKIPVEQLGIRRIGSVSSRFPHKTIYSDKMTYMCPKCRREFSGRGREILNPTTKNPIHPQAIESLKRYKDDLKAGHIDAAEYWRGQAGAYFTANPYNIKNYIIKFCPFCMKRTRHVEYAHNRFYCTYCLNSRGKNPILSGSRREKVVARKGKFKIVELIDFRFHRWFYLMTIGGVLIQRFKKFDQAHDALVKINIGRNPSVMDIAEKHFAKRPSVAHLVGKVYRMPDRTLWQLVAHNDLNIPYFSKVVGNKVGKKQFTIAFWSPNMKPIKNPILSTLGTSSKRKGWVYSEALGRWLPDPVSYGVTEKMRERAWKKGCVI